jgi:hypothetical protein
LLGSLKQIEQGLLHVGYAEVRAEFGGSQKGMIVSGKDARMNTEYRIGAYGDGWRVIFVRVARYPLDASPRHGSSARASPFSYPIRRFVCDLKESTGNDQMKPHVDRLSQFGMATG